MVTQILGLFLAATGGTWFINSIAALWYRPEQHLHNGQPIWGVIAFVGGFIVWALGRIECAIAPSPERIAASKTMAVVAGLLFVATMGMVLWQMHLGHL